MPEQRSIKHRRQRLLGVLAAAACAVSVASPAFAATRDDTIDNKLDGWASSTWSDGSGSAGTHVTTHWCTREFQARIRKNRSGLPDVTYGSEWINCVSYEDAVYSDGDTPTGTYHYDINGMDAHYGCPDQGGFCDYRTTAGVTVHW